MRQRNDTSKEKLFSVDKNIFQWIESDNAARRGRRLVMIGSPADTAGDLNNGK
jgi:hypothetical protein